MELSHVVKHSLVAGSARS